MANFLSQLEKNWFIQQTGMNAPLNQLKKVYYLSQGAKGITQENLEASWLQRRIASLGATPTSAYNADLWKQLVALCGLTVTQYENDNKIAFYSSVVQIGGLILWLRADAITGLNDGDTVASWTDLSGKSNTATQGTGSAQPTYKVSQLNGKPALSFDGGDSLRVANEPTFDLATYSIFTVAKRTAGNTVIAKNTTAFTDGRRRKLQIDISSSLKLNSGADGASITATATVANFNVYGIVARANNDHDLVVNGTVTNSTTALSDDSFNDAPLDIGAAFGNGAEIIAGFIAELIIYNRAVSSTERANLIGYLRNKYGL